MATTSIPLHELVGDNSPTVIIDLMSGLASAALARSVLVLHPAEVVIGRGARVNLLLHRDLPPHPLTTAPELRRTAGTPATLTWAVGALGVLATLGSFSPPPNDDPSYALWLRDIRSRLAKKWGETSGAEQGIALVARCLDRDPAARPSPQALIDEIRAMGFPSEHGLVSRTGYAPPSLEGHLPADVPMGSQGMQIPSQWPPVLSVAPRAPAGTANRPQVKVRPPRTPARKKVGRGPDVRWAAIGIGMLVAVVILGVGARIWSSPSTEGPEPEPAETPAP